jgi:predicted FMN-binding regulatory protein PaiB
MHPNPLYRSDDRELCNSLIDEIGFGMVFAATPEGPRVAHTPLLLAEGGAVQFHLARNNALARHLDGATALIVVNGPDAYVSPRCMPTATPCRRGIMSRWNWKAGCDAWMMRGWRPSSTLPS